MIKYEQLDSFMESMNKFGFDSFHRDYIVALIDEKHMGSGDTITIDFTGTPNFPNKWLIWLSLNGIQIN